MSAISKTFLSYALVALANTLIHWQIFFVLRVGVEFNQAKSNFVAFCVAASFSFYLSALYTFSARVSVRRYGLFICVMGALSYSVGYIGDHWHFHGLLTVALFSSLSHVIGFLFSRFVLFREHCT